jgi:hypothetical protein
MSRFAFSDGKRIDCLATICHFKITDPWNNSTANHHNSFPQLFVYLIDFRVTIFADRADSFTPEK